MVLKLGGLSCRDLLGNRRGRTRRLGACGAAGQLRGARLGFLSLCWCFLGGEESFGGSVEERGGAPPGRLHRREGLPGDSSC